MNLLVKLFRKFSATQLIMLTFLAAILVGSVLLSLPMCSASPQRVPYVDALFTAITSVCVTGLVTVPTVTTWSTIGHVIILILIQIGGLGIITLISAVMISLHRKIGIGGKMMLQDALNLNTMDGMVQFVKRIFAGTFIVEGAGALMYMTVFIPAFGVRGIWVSIFNSVSAFCNAGIDIVSENSLCDYVLNPVVNITTCFLIFMGGIGYIVWWDIIRVLREKRSKGIRCFKYLTLHSKIALSMSVILIAAGAVVFLILEFNNEQTIGSFSFPGKLMASVFQSVTTRTAGFATIPQENFTNASAVSALILMFIGGSPVGTAGGVKTVTAAVLIAAAFATIRGKNRVVMFNRTIPRQAVSKSAAVISLAFLIMFISTVLLSAVIKADAIDVIYETVSATATVGLTRNLTGSVNLWGKIIIMVTMYLGRVGPISLFVAFNVKRSQKNNIKEPTEQIHIG